MPGDESAGLDAGSTVPGGRLHRELLTIDVDPIGNVVQVSLRGELDESTAPNVIDRIRTEIEPGQDLAIDTSGLTFCGSAGLSALILIERQLAEGGGSLTIQRPTTFLVQLLEMAGLDGLVADGPRA